MYREIKFRIWNNKTKSWIHGPHEKSDLDGVNLFGETILLGGFLDGVSIKDLNEIEAVQFTGLTDGFGREIFEGDIVKIEDDSEIFNRRVVYDSGGYFGLYRGENARASLLFAQGNIEIIGNIFENSNLLDLKVITSIAEDEEDLKLKDCELCGENSWDGRICHSCGLKNI